MLGMGWFPDQPGGLNRYFHCLHQALHDAGEEPVAVVLGPAGATPQSVRVVSRASLPLFLRLPHITVAAYRAGRSARLVDAHFALYALGLVLAPGGKVRPLVVHFQGPWAEESRLAGHGSAAVVAKRLIEGYVYRRSDLVVVLSPAFKRLVVAAYGVAPWRVQVVVPGVELERFVPGDRTKARQRFDLPVDGWVALTVRRLVPRVGIDLLLDAWVEVVVARPDALLLIAGDGPDRPVLQRRAKELGLVETVRFLGFVEESDLPMAYQAADLSVVPSTALEGFGLVTLESLASGTPVVVTDVDGLADVPAMLDAGSVVPAGDVSELARRLLGAAQGTIPLTGAAGCRRFAERFSWEAVQQRHVELYRRVIGGGSRRMRVVYLDHVAQLSGGELALARLLNALDDVERHVILAEEGPLRAELERAGASVEVLPLHSGARELRRARVGRRVPLASILYTLAHVLRLARRLRILRPDLVHTNSLKAALYGGAAAKLAGIPVVWHIHDRIAPDYLPAPAIRLVRALAGWLPAMVICNSDATLDTIGGHARRARRIWSGVSSPAPSIPGEARRCLDGSMVVGMVGRLAPWKGQDVFLRAFAAACRDKDDRAVLVGSALFGEDDYERSLHRLVDQLGIGDQVSFRGQCDDVMAQLRGFDILVHASVIPEPFGQVVVEGMAAGLPVVATHGGPSEVVTDGIDGLLVPPGDTDALAIALGRLLLEPSLRARLAQRARATAERFSPEAAAAEVMAVYQECPSGRG